MPALVYQLIWQRALFGAFGVNIEAVTIVVTIFILGLGIGALAGGYLSRRLGNHLLLLFAVLEFAVGILGFLSLDLISWINTEAAGATLLETGAWTTLVLLPPTVLMGASLPVLVQFLVRWTENVGTTFGGLYAANTLGSAAACFASAGGVFIYNTNSSGDDYGDISFSGNGTIALEAQTEGTYAGILFFIDRDADSGTDFSVGGNSTTALTGAIYTPEHDVSYAGTSSQASSCIQIIASTVTLSGTTETVDPDDCSDSAVTITPDGDPRLRS